MERLYIGIKGHVVCLDKATGAKLWDTKLKSTDLTNVYLDGEFIYAYASGHLFCLDAKTGGIKWKNELEGFGYGTCIIAGNQQNTILTADYVEEQRRNVNQPSN